LSLAGRFKPPHLAVHSLSNLDIRACVVPKTLVFDKLYYQSQRFPYTIHDHHNHTEY
jgi:hypothetical protein